MVDIRQLENELFEEWKKKYAHDSFVIDGCPNPDVYSKESRKVIYVLKDGNLGRPDLSKPLEERIHDQRDELENNPPLWWRTMAIWSFFIRNKFATYESGESSISDQDSIRQSLSRHCVVQLKKTWGGGSVQNETLQNVASSDRSEILRQLSIYQPNFIVACGNGEQLADVYRCSKSDYSKSSSGVGYWKIELNEKPCFIIDFCHPSNRAGTKVKGLIAKGLISVIEEIEGNN